MSCSLSRDQAGDGQETTRDGVQRHLYLMLEDWHSGYSIRKVSLPSSSGEDALSLPRPIMHVTVPREPQLKYISHAFGTKIVVVPVDLYERAPVVDVLEPSVMLSPGPGTRVCPILIPVGDDKLFYIDIDSFEVFCWPTKLPSDLLWKQLPLYPFDRVYVSSYAVQPDEAILVSTKEGATEETFIFNPKDGVWKSYGNWALPFTDCGHYDPSLDAFVGLSTDDPETRGYLYSCSVVSSDTGSNVPIIKRSKEKVYSKNPDENHDSATLIYMRRGRYCLAECVSVCVNDSSRQGLLYKYRLMTFYLMYGMDGDLEIIDSRVSYYNLPPEATSGRFRQEPLAFWLGNAEIMS
ncbi:unnamed protein product [Urochloa humidicola]